MNLKNSPAKNTYLSDDELKYFKEKLENQKAEVNDKIGELQDRLDEINKNSSNLQSSQDHHQADLGSLESERVTLLSSLERQNETMNQINVALDRIGSGDYGICVETGQKIQKGRLEAMPHAIRAVGVKV